MSGCSGCPSDEGNVVELAEKSPRKGDALSMSETAAGFISGMMKKQKRKGWGLKLEAVPGGCAGFKYFMGFQEKPDAGDQTIFSRGMKIFVSEDSLPFLVGSEIDYIETLEASGLKINNPNASRTCGCGKSFG